MRIITAILFFLIVCQSAFAALNDHPRLLLTPERITRIQAKAASGTDDDYLRLKHTADVDIAGGKTSANIGADNIGVLLLTYCAMYKATGDQKYLDATITSMDAWYTTWRLGPNWPTASSNTLIGAGSWGNLGNFAQNVFYPAVIYDWIYAELTATYPTKKAQYQTMLEEYADQGIKKGGEGGAPVTDFYTMWNGSSWTNYTSRWIQTIAAIGYALADDSPTKSATYLSKCKERFAELSPALKSGQWGEGGGGLEGSAYGVLQDGLLRFVEMAATSGDADFYTPNSAYFQHRAKYLSYLYHWGDYAGGATPFRMGDHTEYGFITGYPYRNSPIAEILILADRFKTEIGPNIKYLQDQSTKYLGMGSTKGDVTSTIALEAYWDLIYRDSTVTGRAPAKWIGPTGTGEVIVKSSFDERNSVDLHFKSGPRLGYHDHVDQNSFQIAAFGGEFALHSGNYSNARDNEQVGYAMRTVATNGILICDTDESFREIRAGDVYPNDCGQRGFPYSQTNGGASPTVWSDILGAYSDAYKTGRITKFHSGKRFAYMVGDATNAYNNDNFISQRALSASVDNLSKAEKVVRELVFIQPSAAGGETYIAVLDRINVPEGRSATLTKKWLFHSHQKPVLVGTPTVIAGSESGGVLEYAASDTPISVVDGGGKCFIKTLLPATDDRKVQLIGGTGYEQWVSGVNYPPLRTRASTSIDGLEAAGAAAFYGRWRIEMSTIDRHASDVWLQIIQPTKNTTAAMSTVAALQVVSGGIIGAVIGDTSRKIVVFPTDSSSFPWAYQVSSLTKNDVHIISGLTPGSAYTVSVTGGNVVTVSEGGQLIATSAGTVQYPQDGVEISRSGTTTLAPGSGGAYIGTVE